MDSPSSAVRRRAWINSCRRWPSLQGPDLGAPECGLGSASVADDDVFVEGCVPGKIESWLQSCGKEAGPENAGGQWALDLMQKANSFEDELSLGADASTLRSGTASTGVGTPCPKLRPPSLSADRSLSSSFLSSESKSTSVCEVLQLRTEDAEETLYELGFGREEPQPAVRIPLRFFNFPSQAQGINFRLFLDAQLRRIREEDPRLSIASRFKQVEALTAMANALYSLYSHVSRTPLQKLAAPEFTLTSSPVDRMERFRNTQAEPRSPVERLKDTVSKMCLYTGSPRGSDSNSPQPSPRRRSTLPDVVEAVLSSTNGAEGCLAKAATESGSACGDERTDTERAFKKVTKIGDTGQNGDGNPSVSLGASPLLAGSKTGMDRRQLALHQDLDSRLQGGDSADYPEPVPMVTWNLSSRPKGDHWPTAGPKGPVVAPQQAGAECRRIRFRSTRGCENENFAGSHQPAVQR